LKLVGASPGGKRLPAGDRTGQGGGRRCALARVHGAVPGDQALATPSANRLLEESWVLEILYCDPKGSMGFLRILSTEGRGVRLWWAHSKPERPKGLDWILEILCYCPKGSKAFLRSLSTKGWGVGLCWMHSKPKGPKVGMVKCGNPEWWIHEVIHRDPKGSRVSLRGETSRALGCDAQSATLGNPAWSSCVTKRRRTA
jgi:hypothetical protein